MKTMILTQSPCFSVCAFIIYSTAIFGRSAGQDYDMTETTLHCFQCNSGLDKDCINIQPNDTSSYHYKPCLDSEKYNGTKPFCRKIIQMIFPRDNMLRVVRKCGWVKHPRLDCYKLRNEDHIETICQCFEDGCNSSTSLRCSLTNLLLGIFLVSIFSSVTR